LFRHGFGESQCRAAHFHYEEVGLARDEFDVFLVEKLESVFADPVVDRAPRIKRRSASCAIANSLQNGNAAPAVNNLRRGQPGGE
jgi:hypothetical protein